MADCVAKVVGIRRIAKNGQPDLEKMFFAPGPKIVLQHNRPTGDIAA
jgi:hypothetical protein